MITKSFHLYEREFERSVEAMQVIKGKTQNSVCRDLIEFRKANE